jgi:hypothetical protein
LRARTHFGGTEGVGSHFHVLRARTQFRRYRGRRHTFSCFAWSECFSTVPRASCLVFMFCAPGLVFDGTEGVGTRFHVLRGRNSFRRYRGHRVPFSCFACPDSFSAVPTASCPVFMFFASGLVFGGIEGVFSRFHVLRSRNRFQRCRGSCVPFSCFTRPDSISAVPRSSAPVFMFCAPKLGFDGTEGVMSRFHVLRARTRFRRYRLRRVPFSCFSRPDSYSAVPRVSAHVFMFCAVRILIDGTEGIMSRFHVLRARTRFRRYRGRRLLFSCFARPESFSAVPRESCPVFMFCAPGFDFGGTEGVVSRFHVLRARTHFRWY